MSQKKPPQSRPSRPLYKENQPGIVIEDLTILAPPETVGIELVNCPNAIIRRCKVSGGRTCIQADHCDGIQIQSSTVSEFATTRAEEGHGIQLRYCRRAMVIGNQVLRSPLGEDGINLWYSSGQVRGNRIDRHGHSTAGNAITLDLGSHDVVVAQNVCSQQGQRGIVVAAGHGHVIEKNVIDGAADAAIAVQQCYSNGPISDVLIRGNRCTRLRGKPLWIDERARHVQVSDKGDHR